MQLSPKFKALKDLCFVLRSTKNRLTALDTSTGGGRWLSVERYTSVSQHSSLTEIIPFCCRRTFVKPPRQSFIVLRSSRARCKWFRPPLLTVSRPQQPRVWPGSPFYSLFTAMQRPFIVASESIHRTATGRRIEVQCEGNQTHETPATIICQCGCLPQDQEVTHSRGFGGKKASDLSAGGSDRVQWLALVAVISLQLWDSSTNVSPPHYLFALQKLGRGAMICLSRQCRVVLTSCIHCMISIAILISKLNNSWRFFSVSSQPADTRTHSNCL